MVHKKLEALKKERAQLRTSFTNTKKAIEVLLQETESRHKCEKLEAHVQLLDLRIESISNKDAQIAELLYDSEADFSQDVLEEEQSKVDHYQLEFLTVKKLVDSHLVNVKHVSEVSNEVLSTHTCAQAQQFKLPVLQLKKFDGTLKDWLPFWSQFSKIDQDQSMSDIDKMGYLCMSMIPGSPADKLVQSYPATGKMYESVIAALKARFGRDDLLTEYYIRQLLKIVIGNAKTKQPLTALYDTLQCHLRNLETLNVSSENCAPILMPLVSSCLPDDILQIWERSCVTQFAASTSKDECDGSSKDHLQSLMSFLKAEVESEQKIAMAKDGFGLHSSSSQNVSRSKPSKPMSGNSKIATAADLVVTQGPWLEELQRKSIPLTDLQYPTTDIEILIGADVAGRLYTGEVIELESKLVAMNTRLGWTLSGKVPARFRRNMIGVSGDIAKAFLQISTWQQSLSWNDEVHEDIQIAFQRWMTEIDLLTEVNIPRWIADVEGGSRELHVFADACKSAYAAVVFLRIEHKENIQVRLLACKARVAPTSKSSKPMTIPRLELLAALIAARLCQTVVKDYELDGVKTTFWTDASTVLAWLERNDPWDVYVRNRVVEIKQLSEGCTWKHVPGEMNPADLPSRGCYPKRFVKSRWWEGPTWLKGNPEDWPQVVSEFDEEEINMERKKTVVSSMLNTENHDQSWCKYFSNYTKLVRMVAWMRRFKINAMTKKNTGSLPEPQDLTVQEFMSAERVVFRLVQKESPTEMKKMECVQTVIEDDLVRLVTKTSYRNDDENFCYPVVLPASHPVVQRLVLSTHRENCHAGSQTLLAILRQQFWLIGGRRAVRKILKDCVVCKRYTQHEVQTKAIPLPEPRVRDARTFEVTGVDLAGPLFVRTNTNEIRKVWICIFACAVYRAVRLELVWSLSTDSFIQALRRFISRQGRPEIVYSDCGTNFVGFDHASSKIDWNEVSRYSSTKKIEWRFNPPSGPWWGGFYERLIGMMKQLLKRVLGKSRVTCEELLTMLSDCEAVMNSRPLSYMSEDKSETSFLTPAMFLQDIIENGVPEYDLIHDTDLGKRFKYRQELVQELRKKFRDEYLGQLQPLSMKKVDKPLQVGEIVLIGDDNIKRVNWPTGIITEIVEGKDGHARVVKLRTAEGTLTRPVQRIFRLELLSEPRL